MVTVYIGGGLANKMFQYAFSLGIKHVGFDVDYDTKTFKTEFAHDQVRIDEIFPNVRLEESSRSYLAAGKSNKLWRLFKIISPSYIIERKYQYNESVRRQICSHCYAESSWQDERYFVGVANEVREAFIFPDLKNKKNIYIANQMKTTNSVAIHIRKGDGYSMWNILSGTCTKEYYAKALTYIKKHINNPKFFVFTDSPDIVNEYLDFKDYTFINWNPSTGNENYLDMQLMSYAKHNVIANSTYSWWGAWLNKNSNKIVVAPKNWFNPKSRFEGINHIIPDSWIKL